MALRIQIAKFESQFAKFNCMSTIDSALVRARYDNGQRASESLKQCMYNHTFLV